MSLNLLLLLPGMSFPLTHHLDFAKDSFQAFGEGFGDYSTCLLCDMGQDPFYEVPWFFIGMDMASIYLVLTKCQGLYQMVHMYCLK